MNSHAAILLLTHECGLEFAHLEGHSVPRVLNIVENSYRRNDGRINYEVGYKPTPQLPYLVLLVACSSLQRNSIHCSLVHHRTIKKNPS